MEKNRNCKIASKLREIGYQGDIYVSQVIPKQIVKDPIERRKFLQSLKDSGISRFNSGVEKLAKLGVVPSPTVFTPFVIKQLNIPFVLSLDELIYSHLEFIKIIEKYNLPVFSGVFSLA